MTSHNWRDRFTKFAATLAGKNIYITLDLDALSRNTAITNWENDLFTPEDLTWAINQLRSATLIGLDICGPYSPQSYARPLQRAAARFDHPQQNEPSLHQAQTTNHKTLDALWPALARI